MIPSLQCIVSSSSIVLISYLIFYIVSMQIYVHDVFDIRLFFFACYHTISYYGITLTSLFIYYHPTSAFYKHGMHDTTYNTFIVASLGVT
jgi:hypothetical protein